MYASRMLMSAAKTSKGSWKESVPVEVYPLFAAMGFAIVAASYTMYHKFANDGNLRLSRTGKPDSH